MTKREKKIIKVLLKNLRDEKIDYIDFITIINKMIK